MITLNFSVDDQLLTRTDENTVAANSHLVHVCEFTFSSEWDGRGKVATFKKRDLMLSVIVDEDTATCVIPPEILQSDNKIDVFELSVCGADGNSTITSTIIRVPILAGTWDPFTEEITPTLFEQIMQKIDEIEKGEVSPELIYEAVSEYMEAHPLEPVIADDVAAYFAAHVEELKGDKGDTGATPDITATAEVGATVGTPNVSVTKTGTAENPALHFNFQNLKGVKGDTGATPTISAAATVDNTTGTPAVNVSKTGTDAAPEFTFAFSGLKGAKGDPGPSGYDDTEIKAEIADTNQNIRSGRTDYDYNLEFGFYNASGIWTASSKHASVHEMLSFPNVVTLRASTTKSGVTPSIKEYSASGTRLRVVQSNPCVLTDIVEGNKYNFDFFRSNDYAELPTTGYSMQSIPNYFANIDASIERINSLRDNLRQESTYSYTASTQTLELVNHDTKYILKRVVDTAVNLDSWRLYAGYIKINGTWSNMWENSDAEGPIKIDNDSDFISGFHGDEVLQDIAIYIDNVLLDANVDSSGTFYSLVMYQTSTVYHADSQNAAFTRYKKVSFQGNNYSVQQRWKALINCLITFSAMGLVQCYKTNIIGWDTDVLIPLQSKNSGSTALSSETRRGNFIFADGKMITIIADQGMNDEYFKVRLEDFTEQNRLKFYFGMHEGQSLNVDDEITSKFSVVVNSYVAR